MNTALPEDITKFAAAAAKRLARFGGPQAALPAGIYDGVRRDAPGALTELGAFDLDVRSTSDGLLAAAVVCPKTAARSCNCHRA